jgi:hypothetical protein
MGRHSAAHAGALGDRDVYRHVAAVLAEGSGGGSGSCDCAGEPPSPSEDLRAKALRCLTGERWETGARGGRVYPIDHG